MIRRAKKSDIPGINCLLEQVLMVHYEGRPDLWKRGAKKYSDAELEKIILDDERPVFVFASDDEKSESGCECVQGYAFCVIEDFANDNVRSPVKSLYIDDLCVDQKLRGHGIGRALFDFVLDYAKNQGCYNITLNVWQSNPAARAFYDAMGLLPLKTCLEKIL